MPRPAQPTSQDIKLGFDTRTIELDISQIMPLKVIAPKVKDHAKYKQIRASIQEVGIIEPPVVAPSKNKVNSYVLLDGHLRVEVLKELGITQVVCLVSRDDEAFTYNKHISRLSIIQEHRMIVEAINRGVSEEKIAKALNVNVARIQLKRNLLNGICPEAAELLKEKMVPETVMYLLRKVKAVRQIELATLMNDVGNYTLNYAKALLISTPPHQLVDGDKAKEVKGLSLEQMARMEAEMESLQLEYAAVDESYGADILNLTLARGYLGKLLGNARVTRFLRQQHPDILGEFEKVADMTSLAGKEALTA
ncbi:MAG: chromosome partitioning protein ParB [Bacteroidetes bacterium]|nr:chromosome partitioning protein ParB [Bacteroidota bacterium]